MVVRVEEGRFGGYGGILVLILFKDRVEFLVVFNFSRFIYL